jgi:hypothetical protein
MSTGALSLRKLSSRSVGARSTFTTGSDADPYWTSTSLLLHGDGANGASNQTVLDSSANNMTVTRGGNPTQGSFTPFPVTPSSGSSYTPAVNGGSVYFSGTADYLTVASLPAIGTGNFTIECWMNPSTVATRGLFQIYASGVLNSTTTGLGVSYSATASQGWGVYSNGVVTNLGAPPTANTWHHVALCRVGTTVTLYINGTSTITVTDSSSYGTTFHVLGGAYSSAFLHSGYISNFRVVAGTALYTGNFTSPTAPLAAVTNTQLLLSCTNAAIYDSTTKNNIAVVGSAATMTSVNKFGGSSLYFNGTTDYLNVPNSSDLTFGSGDFTIEAWVYTTTVAAGVAGIVTKCLNAASNQGPFAIVRNGATLNLYASSAGTTWDVFLGVAWGTLTANTWTHIALVRNGNVFNGYQDGVGTVLGTNAAALWANTHPVIIGATNGATVNQFFGGYVDDLRITKGVARYTANFIAPVKTFPDKF